VTVGEELDRLATDRERSLEAALASLELEAPHRLRKRLRAYLGQQEDERRVKPISDDIVRLETLPGGVQALVSRGVEFTSESHLDFSVQMNQQQVGWRMIRFRFHLHLPPTRGVNMVRIHLDPEPRREPLRIPRCHLHIGGGRRSHVPFPIMSPLLTLHTICEVIEPDIGVDQIDGRRGRGPRQS
jgi:hypothetical protein